MTVSSIPLWSEIFGVAVGALVLFIFGLALAIPQKPGVTPGSKGHRPEEESGEDEEIRPDGYIDSFAKDIEEAGGGLPPIVRIALPGIIIWWLLYLILFWTQR
jgi:hypothetical protein